MEVESRDHHEINDLPAEPEKYRNNRGGFRSSNYNNTNNKRGFSSNNEDRGPMQQQMAENNSYEKNENHMPYNNTGGQQRRFRNNNNDDRNAGDNNNNFRFNSRTVIRGRGTGGGRGGGNVRGGGFQNNYDEQREDFNARRRGFSDSCDQNMMQQMAPRSYGTGYGPMMVADNYGGGRGGYGRRDMYNNGYDDRRYVAYDRPPPMMQQNANYYGGGGRGRRGGFYGAGVGPYRRWGGYRSAGFDNRRRTDDDNNVGRPIRRRPKLRRNSDVADDDAKGEKSSSDVERAADKENVGDKEQQQVTEKSAAGGGDQSQRRQQRKSSSKPRYRRYNTPAYQKYPPEKVSRRCATIQVSGIPSTVNEKGLYHYMSMFGDVTNVYIPSSAERSGGKSSTKPVDSSTQEEEKKGKSSTVKDANASEQVEQQQQREESGTGGKQQDGAVSNDSDKNRQQDVDSKQEKVDVAADDQKENVKEGGSLKNEEQAKDGKDEEAKNSETEDKTEIAEFYTAYVSFYHNSALRNINNHKEQPLMIHNHPIQIEKYRATSRSKSASKSRKDNRKEENPFHLTDNVLMKIFETMDFKTRCMAKLVCARWSEVMDRVYTPAEDSPANVTLVIRKPDKNPTQQDEDVDVKFNAEKNTMFVTVRNGLPRTLNRLTACLYKIFTRLSDGIEHVEVVNMPINVPLLVALNCDNISSLNFDRCTTTSGMDVNVVFAFWSHFGQRLTVSPNTSIGRSRRRPRARPAGGRGRSSRAGGGERPSSSAATHDGSNRGDGAGTAAASTAGSGDGNNAKSATVADINNNEQPAAVVGNETS